MTSSHPLHIGVALDGAGWHPAAWREPSARPDELFTARYWADLVTLAEAGLLDFVSIEDSLALQSEHPLGPADHRTDEVRGRLDAVLIASRVAPLTSRIGLIPTATTTHTEPFHVSKAIATLDHVSEGRGGWQPKVSIRPDEAAHIGRRSFPAVTGLDDPRLAELAADVFGEAVDVVEVVRRLWDSWEDDAEIRDAATDRFLDADKVHRIDFEGRWFSVRGPAITPRPPQGQPVIAALAHADGPYRFAAQATDLVYLTPADQDDARTRLAALRRAEAEVGRAGEPLQAFADIVVFLDETGGETGAQRLARLDARGRALTSDTRVFTGPAQALTQELIALAEAGYAGARLRPGVATDDLPRIVTQLVPELQRAGAFRAAYEADSLRGLLGLPTDVANRYAAAV